MYFNGEVPEGKEIHHTCSDKTCVNPIHLIAVTHAENTRAKKSTKLSPQKVLEIMALYVSGMPQREIADMFGVAQMTISQTVRGERWKDLSVAPVIAPQTED
jgi:uncharacterized protein YjcR